jgi:hypothetical protein
MRTLAPLLAVALLAGGCAATTGPVTTTGETGGTGGGPGSSGSSGGGSSSSSSSSSSSGGSSSSGSSSSSSGTTSSSSSSSGGTLPPAGNPDGSCKSALPAAALPEDTSHPTTVVGDGTPASCTFARLSAAVATGGIITFRCGADPVTIAVTAPLQLPIDRHTVIDGGGKITLDGGHAVRILEWNGTGWQTNANVLTLQHLVLANGKTTPTEQIPLGRPAPCSQGWNDGEGGALYMRDGNLTVIDCIFEHNHAAPLGPDTGGGAIYVLGSKHGALIVHSSFLSNDASNAGAVGGLFCELDIYDSLFQNNVALGNGANYDDANQCSVINNGQHEVGSGGNGGAIYSDGQSVDITLCGDAVLDNNAGVNAFGGGLFFTSNDMMGTLSIADTTMTGNTGGHWTNVSTGSVTNAGTAVGVNAKSITLTNSTLQGVP